MKKVLCLFLSLILVLGVLTSLPLTVTAVETENIIANGICGDSLFWCIDDNGILTIYGNGKMENYCYYLEDYFYHPTPWDEFSSSIEKCIIENGVTSIGIFSFYDCTNLTSVTIPDTVTNIGKEAFGNCTNIVSITISDNVTHIGEKAFYNTGYYNNENNWENGVLYIGNHLIEAKSNVSGSYIIKYGTKTIADDAFIYANLSSITIPNTITSIGESAFYGISNLNSIKIPDSVTRIGSDAFFECGYYTDLNNWENGVLYINNHLISAHEYNEYYCGSLEGDYTIKQGTITVADNAFENCNITSLVLPDSLVNIGYSGCAIEDGIQTTDFFAFYGCNALTSIEVSTSNLNYTSENGVLFNKSKTKLIRYPENKKDATYIIPNTVKHINYGAFYNCPNLTSITIPDTVTSIGKEAFRNCTNLISITIPDNVTSIKTEAFYDTGYYNDENKWENGILYIGNYLIEATNELLSNEHIVKDGTVAIADFAFYNCDKLYTITIPDSVITIGNKALGYGVKTINAYGNREWYKNTNLIIKGLGASVAETYANENGFSFKAICKHNSTKWITDTKATVYKAGSKHKECTECGEILETATIPQLICSKPVLKKVYNANSYVKVTWNTVKGADLYRVYRKTGTGSYEYIGSTKNTYFNDKEAGAGKTCRYIVKAKNVAGISEASESIAIKHIDEPNLKSIENSAYGVLIKWGKVTGAKTYSVYRKVSGGEYKYLGSTSNTYYTDKTASSGKKYYYAIRAKNEENISSQSAARSKYYLADPTLKAPSSTTKGVGLEWTKVAGAEGYVIYRKTGSSGSYTKIKTEKGVSNLFYRDETAKKGKKYYYKVKAYKGTTYSAYSNTKTITDKY